MRRIARHTKTGERFRLMDDETLRSVMRRTHRFAADTVLDQRAAQVEMRRRKAAGTWTLAPADSFRGSDDGTCQTIPPR